MAAIIENKKDFKIIQMSRQEVAEVFGGCGICDYCGTLHDSGYYIAVLNHWYCKEDHERFLEHAHNYPEDRNIEELNFLRATHLLKNNLTKK